MNISKQSHKYTAGILISDLFDPYQQDLLKGIRSEADAAGVRLLCFLNGPLGKQYEQTEGNNILLEKILETHLDFLILFSSSLSISCGKDGLQKLISALGSLPVISIGSELDGASSIIIDNYSGFYNLVTHFLRDHKVKSPGFIRGPQNNTEAQERYRAFAQALRDNGLEPDEEYISESDFMPGDGIRCSDELLRKKKLPIDALICSDDATAIEAISNMKEMGYRIPEDIIVCGFDDAQRGRHFIPALSTVRQSPLEMGRLALDTALKMYLGKSVMTSRKIQTEMILRESCGCSWALSNTRKKPCTKPQSVRADFSGEIERIRSIMLLDNEKALGELNRNKKFEEHLMAISESLNQSYGSNDYYLFSKFLREYLIIEKNRAFSAMYWAEILSDIYRQIYCENFTEEQWAFINRLFSEGERELYKVKYHISSFNHLSTELMNNYINRIGDRLMTTFTQADLYKIFIEEFPRVQINHLIIVSYDSLTNKDSIRLHYRSGELIESDEAGFKLIENRDYNQMPFVILPMTSENKRAGYVLIELTDLPYPVYEFLSGKITSCLKNIELMEKLNNYTQYLEQTVDERTKELKEANIKLKDLSQKDHLTGLHNRRFLQDFLKKHLESALRRPVDKKSGHNRKIEEYPLIRYALVCVDVDLFKSVNDSYGHSAGDEVLIQLSNTFIKYCRESDYVVRMGGEEFLLVFSAFNEETLASKVEDLRKTIEQAEFIIDGGTLLKKTCSLGAIMFPFTESDPHIITFSQALELADKCLYMAKTKGRNRSFIANPSKDFEHRRSLLAGAKPWTIETLCEEGLFSFDEIVPGNL